MPKGVLRITSDPQAIKGQKIGAWWFNGYQVTPPPWTRASPTEILDFQRNPRRDCDIAIRIDLARGPGYSGPDSGVQPTEWVQLVVWWRPGETDPYSVTLMFDESVPATVKPKMLATFPWARWLAVADAALCQTFHPGPALPDMFAPEHADGVNLRRRANRRAKAPSVKRPGQTGHPDSFYQGIAQLYRELRLEGSTSPTRDIANLVPPPDGPVSRNTAAGWVRIAREKGFLAPGRRGRPGMMNT